MPLKIRCPAGHPLAVPTRYAGRAVRCPVCGSSVAVPPAAEPAGPTAVGTTSVVPTPDVPAPVAEPPPPHAGASLTADTPHASSALSPQVALVKLDAGQQLTVLLLGAALLAAAVIECVPVVVECLRLPSWWAIPPWACAVLLLSLVHIAYGIYLFQLPDWSSIWAVAQVSLLTTAIYALGLAVGLVGSSAVEIVTNLQLMDHLRRGDLMRWCLIQSSLWLVITYMLGRASLRWHRTFRIRWLKKSH